MLEVVADRDVWRLNLEVLPPQGRNPHGHERALKEEDFVQGFYNPEFRIKKFLGTINRNDGATLTKQTNKSLSSYCFQLFIIESLSFNPFFSPFYIGDGRITSSMVVYHSTIFCY